MTTSIEVTERQYNIKDLNMPSIMYLCRPTEVETTYNLYFGENNYKESVWKWKAFYHSLVKIQREAKKNKDRDSVLHNRRILRFLLVIRLHGKEKYKKSIQV